MSKLEILSVFLTERLTLAAQEIFKAVEDIFSEYNEEMCRSRQEIELLKRRLQQAGVQMDSVAQLSSTETQGQKFTQKSSEEWSERDLEDTAMHAILDICTKEEENEEDMPVCSESTSFSSCMGICCDQTPSKDAETRHMNSTENSFHFIDQIPQIKNEPETNSETDTNCQIQQNITKHSSADGDASRKVKVSHAGSPRHEKQTFNLPLRNQEILLRHRMELSRIRERICRNAVL
ncbi:uncharacterized protein LOC122354507 [Puntigrus tetrazona]|uniref:uncharacterized protein LOC122354507 n=1 Tax=Puntigrus tetrazona TaxID=1606681 RepID=UPI001C89770C|nr:uncharacterized protein LOC122354507 [Puntigrus tetrazona]